MDAKIALCITGLSCTGKTTFAESLPFPVLFIGKTLRERYGEDFFTKQKNPGAPPEMHNEISEMIKEFMERNIDESIVGIESTPRTPEQVRILEDIEVDYYRSVIVINLVANDEDRIKRTSGRDKTEEQKKLTAARFTTDSLEGTLDRLAALYFPVVTIDTSYVE